ncbi:MAG: hypothetical protein R3F37_04520 [Candidatus Competibacteraceae bacterium]
MKTNRFSNSFKGLLAVAGLALACPVAAQDADPQVTLFTNVNVFDGTNDDIWVVGVRLRAAF